MRSKLLQDLQNLWMTKILSEIRQILLINHRNKKESGKISEHIHECVFL